MDDKRAHIEAIRLTYLVMRLNQLDRNKKRNTPEFGRLNATLKRDTGHDYDAWYKALKEA